MKKSAILALARYRPWGLLIVLAFASHVSIAQCTFANKNSQRSISYSFEPVFSGDQMALRVTLEFIGGRSGEAELEVPSSYAGQQHLSKAFTELKVLSSQTTLRDAFFSINNYRWRLGLVEGEPKYEDLEKRLAEGPVITVPTITLEGDANGAPHPDASSYARKFSGKYAHRIINGGVGHNLPQEAPQDFAKAIVEVDSY